MESSRATLRVRRDSGLLLTLDQPYVRTTTVLELARKDAAGSVMRSCVRVLGSWTRLAWSSTLLVCLLLAQDKTPAELAVRELSSLPLDGSLTFSNTSSAASDFGLIHFAVPAAVLYPQSVRDVQAAVRAVASLAGLTLAAKGRGHSVHGQAQVNQVFLSKFLLRMILTS
jgi:hypothetical protein